VTFDTLGVKGHTHKRDTSETNPRHAGLLLEHTHETSQMRRISLTGPLAAFPRMLCSTESGGDPTVHSQFKEIQ
jgi:hypothetical protein